MIIVGVARNVAGVWAKTANSLQKIFDAVENYKCVIVESNSSDATLPMLEQWALLDSRRTIVSLGTLAEPSRTARIAACRNKYMELIEPFFDEHSEVLIVDLDTSLEIDDNFKEQLQGCFTRNWDAVASNRRGRYYDIWALRSDALGINYDCWAMAAINKKPKLIDGRVKFMLDVEKYVYSHQKVIPETAGWIPCQSAFGCMVLYKSSAIKGRRYDGSQTCEHVSFNKGLNMFINPAFISGAESHEHC
jgi:hypothetical protein